MVRDPSPEPASRPAARAARQGFLREPEIVAAALTIIRRDGVDGLTMRRLSEYLGVSLGATYKHVSTKDELLHLVTAELFDQVLRSYPDEGDWRTRIHAFLTRVRQVIGAYPGMAGYISSHPGHPATIGLYRPLHAAIVEAGFSVDSVDRVMGVLYFYTSGAMLVPASMTFGRRAATDFEDGLDMVLDGVNQALVRAEHEHRPDGVAGPKD